MTITVDPDWWQTLFDEVYLITDARTVGDAEVTRREVDLICRILPLEPEARILDLCGGQGRHALELCRRGYGGCTVVDYSRPLLAIGHRSAGRQNLPVRFVQGDARQSALRAGCCDHVLILGNSLGYMPDREADLLILAECHRVLASGGRLFLDVADGDRVRREIAPNAWHEINGDVVVCREREVRQDSVCAREMVLSKKSGMIRDKNYRIRLYDADRLATLLRQAGFSDIQRHEQALADPATGGDVGCMRGRLLITALKR
jgi:D-alanine-D-alanine ligase